MTVMVTKTIAGTANVCPYNHHDGLQKWRPPGSSRERFVLYAVPAYEVQVGTARYRAIRFAFRNKGEDAGPHPSYRHRAVG